MRRSGLDKPGVGLGISHFGPTKSPSPAQPEEFGPGEAQGPNQEPLCFQGSALAKREGGSSCRWGADLLSMGPFPLCNYLNWHERASGFLQNTRKVL